MSKIIRCVPIEGKKLKKESFLEPQLTGKTAIDITEDILKVNERNGLDITMCREQGYGNASTIARVHSGVQATIYQLSPKALFVSCTN
ncbi:hypothetical protein AVEN_224576-1 [Araneus ventricosus]|uniref:DUF4371 domain-containing protein n=1 Tax=Araneus ventricosus TaxID=182803 RepID=A0A4Y2PDG4_ARAVE|nr:hypothetical protein AVEN_224576-1 [Araneus ventricosus]